jgi:hypothetical protein
MLTKVNVGEGLPSASEAKKEPHHADDEQGRGGNLDGPEGGGEATDARKNQGEQGDER